MAANHPERCATLLHISNLHCSSCVKTIKECLSSLSPRPLSIDVSVVLQSVAVTHLKVLSLDVIRSSLLYAGFDVAPSLPEARDNAVSSELSGGHSILATRHTKHLQQCHLCMEERKGFADSKYSPPRTEALVRSIVTLSVDGMTCTSCSNTITQVVSRISGVSDVIVSLLGGSTTAVLESQNLADIVRDAIDDCGFEARVVDVKPIQCGNEEEHDVTRTISLRVDGMFCQHCPQKVMSAIESFGSRITIIKSLTSLTDPILTLSYQPDLPVLSMRTIMASIESSSSPCFKVTVYHPPTVEQLSRVMQLRERRLLLFRLLFSIIAAIPTFVIGIVYMTLVKDGDPTKMFLMQPMWTGNTSRSEWALFFIATPVMFYSAGVFHRRSFKEIQALWRPGSTTPLLKRFTRFGSMNLLVSAGVSVAYFSSIGLMALAAATSPKVIGDSTTYFDSVVFLTMFLLAGRFLEAYSKARTADAISALGSLRPVQALLVVSKALESSPHFVASSCRDLEKGDSDCEQVTSSTIPGTELVQISVDHLEVGDVVRIRAGSTPPADGVILSTGQSAFDESSLTGESRLIKKQAGDKAFLGTINKGQVVDMRVDAIGGGTMLDNIIKAVREGQTRRAPIERVADVITSYFVPIVTLLAIITWVVWLSLGLSGVLPPDYLNIEVGGWPVWSLQFAIAVFVVACPCGIGLAAPTALLVGLGLAANYGILARGGGEAFQEMSQLDVVVFDKTGTLTKGGEPRVSDCQFTQSSPWPQKTALGIAAELESASAHPLATAIRHFCENSTKHVGSAFEETAGRGVKAIFENLRCTAIIGNEAWIQEHGASVDGELSRLLGTWKSEAKSIVLLAIRHEQHESHESFQIAAIFAVTDPLRSEGPEVIAWFQEQGISTWMISGDNYTTASAVAMSVGIPSANVIAGVLPHEKSEKIQQLQQHGSKKTATPRSRFWGRSGLNTRTIVAMVGDGINDAPALAAADVGIAIGSGSDIAISSASFVLLSSNLRSLVTLHDLSRRIINRVRFNFLWAVVYNMAAIPIAAGVIYPAGHARLNPVWASLAMALSSVSVVCSSLFLKTYKEPALPQNS